MTRRTITIEEKIAKKQEELYKAKAKFDKIQNELKELFEEKSRQDLDDIIEAVKKSSRDKGDILKFLAGEDEEDD